MEENDIGEPVDDEYKVLDEIVDNNLEEVEFEKSIPVLTINIYSWSTPLIGLIMLILGLLGGYIGRPLLNEKSEKEKNASIPEVISTKGAEDISGSQAIVVNTLAVEVTPTQATSDEELDNRRAALMEVVLAKTRHFLGDEDAPVVMVEFSDFQWPFCGRFASGAGRQITDKYVANGQVKIGYVHFTFLGTESQWAAEASECAADQKAFWEYHDYLFLKQNGENNGAFNKDHLKQFAADINLDTALFNDCLDSGKYVELVQQETDFSRSLGVQSTPSFVINGQPVIGAQSYETFEQVIETELAK